MLLKGVVRCIIRIGIVYINVSHPLAFVEELNKWNRAKRVVVFNDGFRGNDGVNSFVNEKIESTPDFV